MCCLFKRFASYGSFFNYEPLSPAFPPPFVPLPVVFLAQNAGHGPCLLVIGAWSIESHACILLFLFFLVLLFCTLFCSFWKKELYYINHHEALNNVLYWCSLSVSLWNLPIFFSDLILRWLTYDSSWWSNLSDLSWEETNDRF